MFGLYRSVLGLAMITASIFAASVVLSIAPILPGFSGASITTTNGFLDLNFKFSSLWSLKFEIAINPSVEFLYASFW